ncbi:MAG: metal-dependent hydrolase [Planctomycetes bacterium]|nr:metal-dependent hydrolase [Planctomycetota bacterium]
MVMNVPVHRLEHGTLTVEGYSRAAVQTYWRIPELKLGFDLGCQPWDFMGTGTWFVSHAHLDHIAALPVYVARRRMMKMDPPVIYLPMHAVDPVHRLLRVVTRLDRGRAPCDLIGLNAGDEVELSRELVVTASPTRHTVPSLGYVVWDRRRKLRPEFASLTGDRIRDLRLAGTAVTEERRVPLVAYLGDSAPEGLDGCPAMFQAKVLISEMTFVARGHRREKIHKHGHMHLDDYLDRRDRFENERIVAGHFSTRYHDRQIATLVRAAIPDMLDGRLHLFI